MTTLARANLSLMSTTSTPISTSPVLPRLPDELVASATFLLKRLGFSVKDQTMKAYEQTGLHPYHHGILTVLGERSSETQGAIADALGYDRGQLVGLVERRRDPNDRRRHIVRLTADGEKTLRRLRALSKELEDEFLSPLSDEERANLHALLYRLAEKHDPRCAALSLPVSPV
jgi:DNA-binding MarR family transcriptional regulator